MHCVLFAGEGMPAVDGGNPVADLFRCCMQAHRHLHVRLLAKPPQLWHQAYCRHCHLLTTRSDVL